MLPPPAVPFTYSNRSALVGSTEKSGRTDDRCLLSVAEPWPGTVSGPQAGNPRGRLSAFTGRHPRRPASSSPASRSLKSGGTDDRCLSSVAEPSWPNPRGSGDPSWDPGRRPRGRLSAFTGRHPPPGGRYRNRPRAVPDLHRRLRLLAHSNLVGQTIGVCRLSLSHPGQILVVPGTRLGTQAGTPRGRLSAFTGRPARSAPSSAARNTPSRIPSSLGSPLPESRSYRPRSASSSPSSRSPPASVASPSR